MKRVENGGYFEIENGRRKNNYQRAFITNHF